MVVKGLMETVLSNAVVVVGMVGSVGMVEV